MYAVTVIKVLSSIIFTSLASHFVPLQASPAGLLGRFAPLGLALRARILDHFAPSGFMLRNRILNRFAPSGFVFRALHPQSLRSFELRALRWHAIRA